MTMVQCQRETGAAQQAGPTLRRFPHPYRAMLAICSDLDETADAATYGLISRFLNTTDDTPMGPGVGLEVGNTIYFDMPGNQFSYWNTDAAGRAMVRAMIRSGHIDCLHSFGDLATTRAHAGRALDELSRHDCRLEVWIDHAVAPTNFGADIMLGRGDVPGDPAYHADLTCDFGVRYVWRGRVTSVIGQDVPTRLGGSFRWNGALRRAQTIGKEMMKQVLARFGSEKYAMHAANHVLRDARLRDGGRVVEFLRSNPHPFGVSVCDTGRGIGEVLTPGFLDTLTRRGGVCVLYTHLGKVDNPRQPFGELAVRGLRLLAEAHREKRILVTTTRRLLGYRRARRTVEATSSVAGDSALLIDLRTKELTGGDHGEVSRRDLDGLTIYVEDPRRVRLRLDGRELFGLTENPPDQTGRPSVSLPWNRLEFPSL